MTEYPLPPQSIIDTLRRGIVIPAHPLALDSQRRFDERRQRALTRYYHAAGAGGVALGVHTTQFEIRHPQYNLLGPVLELAAETVTECDTVTGRETVCIAGITGHTQQAVAEACLAREYGYHAGLLSLGALPDANDDTLVQHCEIIARELPLFGFYLQTAGGGRPLSANFWRRFVEIPNVIAIKIAPFNRYQTLDVVRAVAESGRAGEIALYTGNDDNIVVDLLTHFEINTDHGTVQLRIVGGLLGHWAYWTHKAVALLDECHRCHSAAAVPAHLLTLAWQITESNAAVFDAAHNFAGVIPGVHEVLRRQGLLENTLSLNPNETLSSGQQQAINAVCRAYPHLTDDAFVHEHLDEWLN